VRELESRGYYKCAKLFRGNAGSSAFEKIRFGIHTFIQIMSKERMTGKEVRELLKMMRYTGYYIVYHKESRHMYLKLYFNDGLLEQYFVYGKSGNIIKEELHYQDHAKEKPYSIYLSKNTVYYHAETNQKIVVDENEDKVKCYFEGVYIECTRKAFRTFSDFADDAVEMIKEVARDLQYSGPETK